jgi:hypothetical protein
MGISKKRQKAVAIPIVVVVASFCVGYWLAVVNKPVPSASERQAQLAAELRGAMEDAGLDVGLQRGDPCQMPSEAQWPSDRCGSGLVCVAGVCVSPGAGDDSDPNVE